MRAKLSAGMAVGLLAAAVISTAYGDDVHRMMALAKVDIVGAIEIAAKHIDGGLVVYVELKEKHNLPVYEAKVIGDEKRYELLIDGRSGAVTESKTKKLHEKQRSLKQEVLRMGVTLPDALPYLESKKPGAQPYRMEFGIDYDALIYKLRLLGGEKRFEFQARYAQPVRKRKSNARKPPARSAAAPVAKPVAKSAEPPAKPKAARASAPSKAAVWNFDDVSSANAGWNATETRPTKSLATWKVIEDPSAPSKPNVMALTDTRNYDGTFNIAVQESSSYKDFDLSIKVKGVKGDEDQGGGPLWRGKDENNYYVCRFNPLEDNFRVYKVIDGRRKQLASARVQTEVGKWYTVRVTMIGERITCYLDGKTLLEATDDALREAGVVGLWTKADAVTSFDDLAVKPAHSAGSGRHGRVTP